MSLSNIVGQKTNTIAAWLIGILFLVLSTNAPRALEFSRHSADSSGLNAIAATGRIEAGDSEKLLGYLRTLPGKPNTAIYLSSPGGSLIEGLKLGYLFKEMRIKTVVEGDRPNSINAFDRVRVFPTAAGAIPGAIQWLSQAAPPPLPLPSLGCFAEAC
jgi:hypothetical protein